MEVVVHCIDCALNVKIQLSLGEWVEDSEAAIILCLRGTVSAVYLHQVAILNTIVIFQVLKGLAIDVQSLYIHYSAILARGLL